MLIVMMRFMFVLGLGLAVLLGVAFADHPAAGHPLAGSWSDDWHYPDSSLSIGDLTFMPREDYPVFDQLTQLEQYMLVGVTSSSISSEGGLMPWRDNIFAWVNKFYLDQGYIPDVLTPDVIRSISGYEDVGDENLITVPNPLTGEWPRLNAEFHSPGDLYIRPLTEEEIDFFADNGREYLRNLSALDRDGTQVRTSPVYYVRMYGWDGVLSNGFKFISSSR